MKNKQLKIMIEEIRPIDGVVLRLHVDMRDDDKSLYSVFSVNGEDYYATLGVDDDLKLKCIIYKADDDGVVDLNNCLVETTCYAISPKILAAAVYDFLHVKLQEA